MAYVTSEEAGKGVPVCLICLLLVHRLAKTMNIHMSKGSIWYLVWVGFSREGRISLHLFVF